MEHWTAIAQWADWLRGKSLRAGWLAAKRRLPVEPQCWVPHDTPLVSTEAEIVSEDVWRHIDGDPYEILREGPGGVTDIDCQSGGDIAPGWDDIVP